MLTIPPTNSLRTSYDFPPEQSNIENSKPENPNILNGLSEEDPHQVKVVDHPSLKYLNEDILYSILSNFKFEAPSTHRRIEGDDKKDLKTFARINKRFRHWVFDLKNGLFKDLGSDHYQLISKRWISFERLLGIVNQIREADSEKSEPWFEYIKKIQYRHLHINENLALKAPAANPNVFNHDGESPFSLALSLYMEHPETYEFLLEELYAANVSDILLAKALTTVFLYPQSKKDPIQIANEIIARIKANGNEKLIKRYVQANLDKIVNELTWNNILAELSRNSIENLSNWLEEIGVEYTLDALCHLYRNENLFNRLIKNEKLLLNTELKSGDHLIHFVLKNSGFNNEKKLEYIRIILNRFPEEINMNDSEGQNILSILLIQKLETLLPDLKNYINESTLYTQHNGFHSTIVSCILNPLNLYLYLKKENYLDFFLNLRPLFTTQDSYENWLVYPSKNSLLHEIAFFYPDLLNSMLCQKNISEEICEAKDSIGETVSDILKRQTKLINFINKKNPSAPLSFDPAAYRTFNARYKENGRDPYIIRKFKDKIRDGQILTLLKNDIVLKKMIIADPNVTDCAGNTILHLLFNFHEDKDRKQILRCLLDYGVAPKIKNAEGKTVLDIAKKNKDKWAYEYLDIKH